MLLFQITGSAACSYLGQWFDLKLVSLIWFLSQLLLSLLRLLVFLLDSSLYPLSIYLPLTILTCFIGTSDCENLATLAMLTSFRGLLFCTTFDLVKSLASSFGMSFTKLMVGETRTELRRSQLGSEGRFMLQQCLFFVLKGFLPSYKPPSEMHLLLGESDFLRDSKPLLMQFARDSLSGPVLLNCSIVTVTYGTTRMMSLMVPPVILKQE